MQLSRHNYQKQRKQCRASPNILFTIRRLCKIVSFSLLEYVLLPAQEKKVKSESFSLIISTFVKNDTETMFNALEKLVMGGIR